LIGVSFKTWLYKEPRKSVNQPTLGRHHTQYFDYTSYNLPIGKNFRREARRWPNAVVPVLISPGQFNNQEIQVIQTGMREIMSKTCIRFVNYAGSQQHPNYIRVTANNEEDCRSSWIGMRTGEQQLTLGHGANCIHSGVVAHEFMHTLGFWHEHVRFDRDRYVTVMWDNIRNGRNNDNFFMVTQQQADTFNLPYEFDSIMHYIWNLFSIDPSKPTLVSKIQGRQVPRTHRYDLSQLDALKINKAYNCRGF